jgi:YfiH family protein
MTPLLEKEFSSGKLSIYPDRPPQELIEVEQIHSNTLVEYNGNEISHLKADGIIIDPLTFKQSLIAIKTADCLPVLLIGEKIAFIHAGWRGLQNQILIDTKLKHLNIREIFIGPFIKDFQVQHDFKAEFPKDNNFYEKNNKLYFDLMGEAMDQLQKCYKEAKIDISPICTLNNTTYNSYRRNKTKTRNWNVFHLK